MSPKQHHDPFEVLPSELIQIVFNMLPISYAWRLGAVNKLWNKRLMSHDILRVVATRWNTHPPEQRASREAFPSPTLEQHARRAESFLSGQPPAFAILPVEAELRRGVLDAQLQGRWLAYRTNHQLGGTMHIELVDLVTGRKRTFDTESTENPALYLTTDLLAYTTCEAAFGDQKWDDKPLNNVLNTISLHDFSKQQAALYYGEAMQCSVRGAAHKQCTVIVRHRGVSPYNELVQIFDRASGKSWKFTWNPPVDDGMSFTFTIDADRQVVTFLTAYTKYASGPSRDIDGMMLRCMMSIHDYSFEGEELRVLKKDILLDEEDHREMGMFGPWIMSLTPAGSPASWSTDTSFWGENNKKITIQLDWNSAATQVDAYYRSTTPAMVWKDVVFYHNDQGELCIGRNSSPLSMDARSVSRCTLEVESILAEPDDDVRVPDFVGVNESYLVTSTPKALQIFAFDELAVQIPSKSQELEAQSCSLKYDSESRVPLDWKSSECLFVRYEGPSIVHRRVTERGPAREASGPDPVLDAMKRVRDMLDEPL